MQSLVQIILVVCGVWLALLTFVLIRSINHYRKLTIGTFKADLKQILEGILSKQDINAKQISELSKGLEKIESKQKEFFQKYALIRYNPFEQTGGDQSFTVALLDSTNNGIVISSLHARESTRVYAKEVLNGKATKHQFSKEEKEVVEKAAHQLR